MTDVMHLASTLLTLPLCQAMHLASTMSTFHQHQPMVSMHLSSFAMPVVAQIIVTFYYTTALVTRLLSRGYKVNRLPNTFKKFYGKHTDLVGQYIYFMTNVMHLASTLLTFPLCQAILHQPQPMCLCISAHSLCPLLLKL